MLGSSPSISPSHPQDEEKSYLNVSDWVTYLSSEKSGTVSAILNVCAIFLAVVALALSVLALIYSVSPATHTLREEIGVIIAVLVVVILFGVEITIIVRRASGRGTKAENLLEAVMTGKLSEPCIRFIWLKQTQPKKADRNTS